MEQQVGKPIDVMKELKRMSYDPMFIGMAPHYATSVLAAALLMILERLPANPGGKEP